MADFTHPYTATQHFRRKPPSGQVRSDQRRAAERTRQNPEANEHSPSGLFQPTPSPTTAVAAHLEMQCENDTQHTYTSDTDTDARASRSPDYSAPASSRPRDTDGVVVTRQPVPGFLCGKLHGVERTKMKLKLYKTVLISLRKGLFSVATIWRRAEIMLAV